MTLSAGVPCATAAEPVVTADNQDYDINTGVTTITGHATFALGDLRMHADKIVYATQTGVATATGNVVLVQNARRVLADEVVYFAKDNTYKVKNPRLGEFPVYLRGSAAEGNADKIVLSDAEVSYFEPGPLAPTLDAKRVVYDMKGNTGFTAESPNFGIGIVRPFAMPKLNEKTTLALRSYITLSVGYRGNLGPFVEPGIRYPLGQGLKAGADFGFYWKRGFMVGPAGEYSVQDGDAYAKGELKTGYINDHGDKKTDVLGEQVPEGRGYAEWVHHQKLSSGLTLDANVNYWSDSEIVRDFRPKEFFPVQVPDNYVESTYSGQNYQVSLFSRFQPNTYHDVQERLPELRVDVVPTPLVGGIYQRLASSYVVLREDPPAGRTTLQSDRADVYYGLTRNFSNREWYGATAVAGGRITNYSSTKGAQSDGDYTRTLGEVGFDAQLNASGTFDYKNERWGIDGLRHLVTPKISYRYIPEADKGRKFIPQIDRETFNTYLPQLGLSDARYLDDLHKTNTLRVGVENTLQTRDKDYGSRDLVRLTLANDFRFDREVSERKVSETHVDFSLMPVRWMSFDLYQSVDPHNMELRELNTGFSIRDGELWSLRLSTHYLRHDIAEYVADFDYRINEQYSATARLHYDFRRSRLIEQSYGLRQKLGRTWSVRYMASMFDGPRREGSFEFHFEITAIGL